MIERHLWGFVNAIVTGTTNSGAESIDSRIEMGRWAYLGCETKSGSRQRFTSISAVSIFVPKWLDAESTHTILGKTHLRLWY